MKTKVGLEASYEKEYTREVDDQSDVKKKKTTRVDIHYILCRLRSVPTVYIFI